MKVLGPPMPAENTASDRDNIQCKVPKKLCFTVVVLGASGDLAKKKTFPALFLLFSRGCVSLVEHAWSVLTWPFGDAAQTDAACVRGLSCCLPEPCCRFLPENLSILGYARSKLSKKDLQEKVKPNLKGDDDKVNEFLEKLDYEAGPYDKPEGYQKVCSAHSSA